MARQLFCIILATVAIQCVMMATIPLGNLPLYLEHLRKANETTIALRSANESTSVGHHHIQKRYAEDTYEVDANTEYYQPTTTSGYHQPTTTTTGYGSYTTEKPYDTTNAPFFGLKQKGKLVIKELDRAIKTVIAYIAGVLLTPFVLVSKVLPPPPPPIPVTEYY